MSKQNLFRAFTVAGVTAAFLGAALIPGIAAPKSANATDVTPLISSGETTWKYSDTNTDPAAGGDRLAWVKDGFAIPATWKEAKGAFGFKINVDKKTSQKSLGNNASGSFINTIIANSPEGIDGALTKTYHFVTTVNVTKAQLDKAESGFRATVKVDDSAQVFVNGQKVTGILDEKIEAAPEAQRNLMYSGFDGDSPAEKTFDIPKDKFKEGKNTVAVAVYQGDKKSSDAYFDFKSLAPLTKAEADKVTPKALVQTIGATAADRNFTWYTVHNQNKQELQYAPKADVKGGVFPANATKVPAKSDGNVSTAGFLTAQYNHRASITGLKENTEYVYRVGNEATGWSEVQTFKTAKYKGDYSFLFFGDPQVGSSKYLKADEEGWIDTINLGVKTYPNTELLFSAGDQVQDAPNEAEYDAFLAPKQMRSIPLVPVIGNHDVYSKAFDHHFTVPNLDQNYGGGCATYEKNCPSKTDFSSGDYYFEYKGTLFVILNSNANSPESIKQHNEFLEKAVKAHPNAKWKAVGFHHSVYSAATHAVKSGDVPNINALRGGAYGAEKMVGGITGKISELGFNFVLMGHDHSYVRTYLLNKDGVKSNPDEQEGQKEVVAKHGDVLYVTGNSASGSKFYPQDLRVASDTKNAKLPVAPYASVINQETLRNYTNIDVQECKLTFTTLVSGKHPKTTIADQVKNDAINHVVDKVVVKSPKPECADKVADAKPTDPKSTEQNPVDTKQIVEVPVAKAEFKADKAEYLQGDKNAKLSLSGFAPNTELKISIVKPEAKELVKVTTNAKGEATVPGDVIAKLAAGEYELVASGAGQKATVKFKIVKELADTGANGVGVLFGAAIALTAAGATVLAVARRRQA